MSTLFAIALATLALAAEPAPLVAAPMPEGPTAPNFWATWLRETEDVMQGRTAAPVFRDAANGLDVHWRVQMEALDPVAVAPWPAFTDEEEARVLDLAMLGATMGMEQLVRETIARAEGLDSAQRALRTLTGPSLELRAGPQGPKVRVNPDRERRAVALAMLDEPRRRPPPSAQFGSGMRLVELDEQAQVYALGVGPYVQVRSMGVDHLRLEATMIEGQPLQRSGQGLVQVSEGLVPGLRAIAEARWNRISPEPSLARAGLQLALPARFTLTPAVSRADRPEGLEWKGELVLRAHWAWRLPQSQRAWPLGLEPGA